MYKKLVFLAAFLAFCVVVLGAFVRLSDAGLGCPDWPGCYGKLTPHHAAEAIAEAAALSPGGPVSIPKAWKEMVHRYFAGALGLLIALIAVWSWRKRKEIRNSPALPSVVAGLVVFQALLGMWTVTQRLKPVIVTTHLLGGMTTFALLVWLAMRQLKQGYAADRMHLPNLRAWARLGLALVFLQIALGGWVSSNYAALACAGFPLCNGSWWPSMDFPQAFDITRDLGMTSAGAYLSSAGLTAIHWVHRLGAYTLLLYVGALALAAMRIRTTQGIAVLVLGLLLSQVGLGVANVLLGWPLALAVAHNAVAALLLAAMVALNYRLG